MDRESKVHSGKGNNYVPVSRQKFSKLSLPGTVDGSDGSSISESSSSNDSSSSVNSYKRKQPRGRHEDLQRRKCDTSKAAKKKSALDKKQIEGQNSSDLLSDQASATNDDIKPKIQDAGVVMILAKHVLHKYSIKFELFRPYGLVEFKEEVAKRLPQEGKGQKLRGDYTIQYKHGDKLISMNCDDDLRLHVETSREVRKCVEVLLI